MRHKRCDRCAVGNYVTPKAVAGGGWIHLIGFVAGVGIFSQPIFRRHRLMVIFYRLVSLSTLRWDFSSKVHACVVTVLVGSLAQYVSLNYFEFQHALIAC